jgi:hypothetical protein
MYAKHACGTMSVRATTAATPVWTGSWCCMLAEQLYGGAFNDNMSDISVSTWFSTFAILTTYCVALGVKEDTRGVVVTVPGWSFAFVSHTVPDLGLGVSIKSCLDARTCRILAKAYGLVLSAYGTATLRCTGVGVVVVVTIEETALVVVA